MMREGEQKQQRQLQIVQGKFEKQQIKSHFLSDYCTYFHGFANSKQSSLSQLSKSNDIEYDQVAYRQPFSIKLIKHSLNYQILTCKVEINYFKFVIHIYNHTRFNKTHAFNNISSTKIGIYQTCLKGKQIVIKCLPILMDSNFQQKFIDAVRQYCITKIASILKIGPSIDQIFGFDLIMYDDCIEFGMQRCERIKSWSKQDQDILKKKLYRLHQLHIVHQDIKPMNIMFSPSIKQYVLIDYGFSRVVVQNIGERSQSVFMGSFAFCSPQMTKCYYEKQSLVDLYYNDIFGLQKSVKVLQKFTPQRDNNNCQEVSYYDSSKQKKIHQQLHIIYIKSKLYLKQEVISNQDKKFMIQHSQIFIKFFKTLPFCWERQFFKWEYLTDRFKYKEQRICLNINRLLKSNKEMRLTIHDENDDTYRINRLINGIVVVHGSNRRQAELKQILSSHQEISKLSKLQYYYLFINFIDICSNKSAPFQKIIVAKVMIQVQSLSKNTQQTPIQICLQHLLEYFLGESICKQSYIEILLSNLIIYQTYSAQELSNIYLRICELKLQTISHIQLLYNCFIATQWIVQRAITRYKFSGVVLHIHKMIIKKIHQMASKYGQLQPTLYFVEALLTNDKEHSKINDLSTKIIPLKGKINYKFWLDLSLHINLNQLDLQKYGQNYLKTYVKLQKIYDSLQKNNFQDFRVDYVTLRMLKVACDRNISQAALDYYGKLSQYFRDQSLICKFKFHYTVQYNIYCNRGISHSVMMDQLLKYSQSQCFIHDEQILSKFSKLVNQITFYQYYTQNSQIRNRLQFALRIQKLYQIKLPSCQEQRAPKQTLVKYCKIHFLYFRSIQYFNQPNTVQVGRKVIDMLRDRLKGVQSVQCLFECQKYVSLIQAQMLNREGSYKESIQLYMNVLYKILESGVKKADEYILIQQIMFKIVTIAQKRIANKQQASKLWQQIMIIIEKHYLFWIILAPHFSQQMYNYVCIHNFIIEKMYIRFFCMYLAIILFISIFHSSPMLKFINYKVIELAHIYPQKLVAMNDEIKKLIITTIPKIHIAFKYINLLFSAFLRYQKRKDEEINKVMRFICEDITLVHYQAKNMILGNVYYYKLNTFGLLDKQKNKQDSCKKRAKIKLFKSYVKYDVLQITFKEFLSQFTRNDLRKKNRCFQGYYKQKIIKYFDNIQEQNLRIIRELDDLYKYQRPF